MKSFYLESEGAELEAAAVPEVESWSGAQFVLLEMTSDLQGGKVRFESDKRVKMRETTCKFLQIYIKISANVPFCFVISLFVRYYFFLCLLESESMKITLTIRQT